MDFSFLFRCHPRAGFELGREKKVNEALRDLNFCCLIIITSDRTFVMNGSLPI